MTTTEPLLEVEGLTAGYGGVAVLRDVSLRVDAGEMVGLLGANNAGKSTLIHCLSGVVKPMAGRIRFKGEDVTDLPPEQIVERGIIQVPEGRLVFPQMSVRENLMMGSVSRRAKPRRKANLERVLSLFPRLHERMDQPAGTMSGGEQQMLAIGRGMMACAEVLMLDEPSLGLSPLIVQHIFEIVRKLHAEGLSILLVEQNSSLTFRHASRCYVLEQGRVAIEGPSSVVREDPATRKAYLGM
ncbi:ABC transporter ATP-binding protein [Azospirillum sp.]|uniref:ABC transporter ATP-binding protein n=1 Tax=Azospirillum sp. TaxID=34012 RepID=UPI002D26C635|nr:ABC transporter ATP-binding protein [Azospirillum sp.]HYD71206.1 ABC transporter ATP-binding protein [Azospirillum sp.]